MGVMLSSPVELTRVQRKGSPAFRCAVAEMQGWRTNHEDAHAMYCDDRWGSFWVLDGHGGDGASIFCAPKLLDVVGTMPQDGKLPPDNMITKGFESVDQDFRNHVCENPEQDSGSTVVGALVAKQEDGSYSLKVLNCGDSRALVVAGPGEESPGAQIKVKRPTHLIEGETAVFPLITVSVDHKPDYPTEKERIEAQGGFISQDEPPRLDGNLAVSRGMGDFEYKCGRGVPAAQQKVSCVPDIYEVHGLKEGSVCVLACDGLWDVMTDAQVAEIVMDHLKEQPNVDLGVICADLVHKALEENSRDNVTVMIIQMVDGSDWAARSKRFNDSDEIMYFDKLVPCSVVQMDEELRKQYASILRRWKFPTKPVQCSVSGRWFRSMWKCPGTGDIYINKHCQKIGWAKHKNAAESDETNQVKATRSGAPRILRGER